MESRLRLLLVLAGLPPAALQHVVRDRHGAFVGRVDLWYPGLVVEVDGYAFHGRRDDFRRDLRKGVEYARLGLLTQRFSWEDVGGRGRWIVSAVGDAVSSTLAEPAGSPPRSQTRRRAG